MNRFMVGYWQPIYGFLRAKTHSHEMAEDLTQEFENSWSTTGCGGRTPLAGGSATICWPS